MSCKYLHLTEVRLNVFSNKKEENRQNRQNRKVLRKVHSKTGVSVSC